MQVLTKTHRKIAAGLRRKIGAHVPLIGTGCDNDVYQAARAESDQAVSLAHYLIDHMETSAIEFAAACGLPGHFKQLHRTSDVQHTGR